MKNHAIPSSIIIDANTANQRLDRFLRKLFRLYPDISLVMIFKAIRTGQIKIDQRKRDQSYFLKVGETLTFHESFMELLNNKNPVKKQEKKKRAIQEFSLTDFQSRIISEDEERLVINKPAGITIHPGQQTSFIQTTPSLYDFIKQYYSSRGFSGSMFQPNVAYRLDKETSGLVIVAKTYAGLQHLNSQIRERKIDKMYYSILIGTFPKQLTCNKSLKKVIDQQFGRGKMVVCNPSDADAQEALSIGYSEKNRSDPILGPLSLVKVKIETGRMHQIRVHMADAGYPVLGDIVYGIPSYNRKLEKNYNVLRQLLHCRCYSFRDMNGKELSFEAPLLSDMKKIIP